MAFSQRILAGLAAAALLAAFPAALRAQGTWGELGGSASGGGISNSPGASEYCSIGLDAGGNPVVAWQELVAGYEAVYVKRWNPASSRWEELAGSASGRGIGPSRGRSMYPILRLDSRGYPVVAWVENAYFLAGANDEICLKRWNGSAWEELGGSGTIDAAAIGGVSANPGRSQSPSLDLDSAGRPFVAWHDNLASPGLDNHEIFLRYWTGSAWAALGSSDTVKAGGVAGISADTYDSQQASVAIDPEGLPVVTWREGRAGQKDICVRRWTGSTWAGLGESGSYTGISGYGGGAPTPDSEAPFVAVTRAGHPVVMWEELYQWQPEFYAKAWNGSAWTAIGTTVPTGLIPAPPVDVGDRYFVLDALDRPVIAWEAPGSDIYVKRWSGSAWVEEGGSARSGGISASPGISKNATIAVDRFGQPVVAWTDYSSGNADIRVRRYLPAPAPPETPEGLAQFRVDGRTPKELGERGFETGFVVTARLHDRNYQDLVALEVELRPVGVAFTGAPTASGPVGPNGAAVALPVNGLPDGVSYHWQARAIDNTPGGPAASPWISFGGNPEGEPDFSIRSPNTPPAASSAGQGAWGDGQIDFSPGASYFNRSGVGLQVYVSDADEDEGGIEVEVRRQGEPFSGVATAAAIDPEEGLRILHLELPDGSYCWQYRTVDVLGAAGPWTAFGGNPDSEADFTLIADGSSNAGSCLQSAAGSAGLAAVLAALLLSRIR